MGQRVVDQIDQQLHQQIFVGDEGRRRGLVPQGDTRLLGHRGVLLEHEAHGIGQVKWRALRGESPCI